jgi:hypothetical protein
LVGAATALPSETTAEETDDPPLELNVMVTGSIGDDRVDFTALLFVDGAIVLVACFLLVAVLEGADNAGDTQTAASLLEEALEDELEDEELEDEELEVEELALDVCDEGDDDDGVTPHAERTMANKVRKKLDFTLECI